MGKGSKGKWSITINVTDVKGGSGLDFRVDSAFGRPVPSTERVCEVLAEVRGELLEEIRQMGLTAASPMPPLFHGAPAIGTPTITL